MGTDERALASIPPCHHWTTTHSETETGSLAPPPLHTQPSWWPWWRWWRRWWLWCTWWTGRQRSTSRGGATCAGVGGSLATAEISSFLQSLSPPAPLFRPMISQWWRNHAAVGGASRS